MNMRTRRLNTVVGQKKGSRSSHVFGTRLAAAFLGVSLILSGCAQAGGNQGAFDASSEQSGKLKVAVTLFPYYDFVRQIAGDQVDLQMVIPAGMDSHSFEPTPADIRTIQHADVLISNGGTMEHWLDETLAALDTTSMTIVTMMDYVDTVEEEIVEGMEDADHDHDHAHVHAADDHDHSNETPEEQVVFGKADYFEKYDAELKNEIRWIIPNAQKNMMEPILITLEAGGSTYPDNPHEGEEFGYVLQGSISIHIGSKTYRAKKGESFYFTPDKKHYLTSRHGASLIWVSTPPSF